MKNLARSFAAVDVKLVVNNDEDALSIRGYCGHYFTKRGTS